MKFLVLFSCAFVVASAGWTGGYNGPYHVPVIGPNGVPVDTPEVQHARAAHFAALGGAATGAGPYVEGAHDDGSDHRYYGPHAYQTTHGVAQVTPDGVPIDTPEVAAAKANHFGAFSEALARAPHGHHYRKRRGIYAHYPAVHDYNFYGLAADGRPLDTPEVAHAKAAHFAAFNEAAALNGVGHAGHYAVAAYAAPWAHAAIHNGVPADTPEVAAAKAAHFAAHAAAAHH